MGLSFTQRFVHLRSEIPLNMEFIQAVQRKPAMTFNCLLARENFLVPDCQGDSQVRISRQDSQGAPGAAMIS